MSRMMLVMVVWVVMMVGLMAGLHYYFWIRLVRDTAFGQPWRTVLTASLATLAASIPLTFWIGRQFAGAGRDALVWIAFVWMGLMFLLFLGLVAADLARWLAALGFRFAGRELLQDPERRMFLSRLVAGGAAASAVGLSGLAVRAGARPPELKKVQVALSRLPERASGTTIVQITDLHVGQPITRDYVEDIVQRTNALAPDVIAITGDLVDGSTTHLRDAIAPIADLTAKHGVFFVTGNHEYYSGVEPWLETLRDMGIQVLRNEHVVIGDGDFVLAGVDDSTAHRLAEGHGEDVAAAVAGVDPEQEIVLLAHQPKAIDEAAKHGVGLQISGHTHGGQIWPFTLFVHLAQPYVAGLARHGDTQTQIYVSRGTGHWGPPMRLGAPSELTVIELVRSA